MRPHAAPADEARAPWILYLGLTLAVWGLFALDRGLWHDDVQVLFRAFMAPGREGLFPALASPTRRLLAWPSWLALASGRPLLVLELMAGATWLATGLVAQGLARRLWPDAPWSHVAAAVLTLVATPDGFTNGLVALGYLISILAYLTAAWAVFSWIDSGRAAWLAASVVSLNVSLWMTDAALLPWVLTPLLWAAARTPAPRRRLGIAAAAWYAAALPYLFVLAGAFTSSTGYLSQALLPIGAAEWLRRLARLLAYNFEPWRWAFARQQWLPAAGSVVPLAWRVVLASAAGIAVARRLGPARALVSAAPRRIASGVAATLVLMAAANATFAGVQMSESMVRTHLLSRVFAALALAGALAGLRARGRAAAYGVAALGASWAALGVGGGLERQDYFAAYWRVHRGELRSIVEAVPRLAPGARLLLHVPAQEHYLATEAGYLARAWTTLIYSDPTVECRVFLWSARRSATTCTPLAEGYECRGERSPDCQRADGQATEFLPYERLIVLEYSPADDRYHLVRTLPAGAPANAPYAPEASLVREAPRALARALLYRPPGLAERAWPSAP